MNNRERRRAYMKPEEEFITICEHNPVDYERLNELLNSGVDINREVSDWAIGDSILAGIILEHSCSDYDEDDECDGYCSECEYYIEPCISNGESLYNLIKFFVDNGFDVSKYGGECLENLCWPTYDEWALKAAKILLNNGADANYTDVDGHSLLSTIGTEASNWTIGAYDAANLMCAYYELVEAAIRGDDYNAINAFGECIGHKVRKIEKLMCEEDTEAVVNNTNCYNQLVIWCDDIPLYINKYPELYVNPLALNQCESKLDISEFFSEIIGLTVKSLYFVDEQNAILQFEESDVSLLLKYIDNNIDSKRYGRVEIVRPMDNDLIGKEVEDIIFNENQWWNNKEPYYEERTVILELEDYAYLIFAEGEDYGEHELRVLKIDSEAVQGRRRRAKVGDGNAVVKSWIVDDYRQPLGLILDTDEGYLYIEMVDHSSYMNVYLSDELSCSKLPDDKLKHIKFEYLY